MSEKGSWKSQLYPKVNTTGNSFQYKVIYTYYERIVKGGLNHLDLANLSTDYFLNLNLENLVLVFGRVRV